jgi:multidrug efflux system outer membrane protein
VDVLQAEQLVETASAVIPDTERQIQQDENQIGILLGRNPGPGLDSVVPRGLALTDQPLSSEVPPGIPSRLLERRPDIREAEQNLIAANANIGVARAAFFPDVSLTALAGVESTSLTTLFRGPSRTWTWTAQATEPIFDAGKIRSNFRLAQQKQQEALLTYKQAIQKAFGDVSDALIAYRKYREEREHQERLVTSAKGAADLSRLRYQGGAASYLEVLTNDTNAFSAELNLAAIRLGENAALVQIYESLGGGWEQ